MNRLLLVLIIISAMLQAGAQDYPYFNPMYTRAYNPIFVNPGLNNNIPNNYEDTRLNVNVQLGTSFATDFNRGFSFSTFVAPELRYRVSDRLSIRGGISITNSEYGNSLMYSPYGFSRYTGNMTQGIIFVSGDYILGPKLILSGTAYKEFSINQNTPETGFNPGYDGKGLMMNLRFMPADNVTIDAGIEVYQGNNPYRNGIFNSLRPIGPRQGF